jgi:hypothetical protein
LLPCHRMREAEQEAASVISDLCDLISLCSAVIDRCYECLFSSSSSPLSESFNQTLRLRYAAMSYVALDIERPGGAADNPHDTSGSSGTSGDEPKHGTDSNQKRECVVSKLGTFLTPEEHPIFAVTPTGGIHIPATSARKAPPAWPLSIGAAVVRLEIELWSCDDKGVPSTKEYAAFGSGLLAPDCNRVLTCRHNDLLDSPDATIRKIWKESTHPKQLFKVSSKCTDTSFCEVVFDRILM